MKALRPLRLLLCLLLLPLSIWYPLSIALRNLLYALGLKHSAPSSLPTVGIGNLRVGGTGKTPHTELLIRLFGDRRTALLSRGYGRKSKGALVAKPGQADATLLGDEPAMMAAKYPALTVAVAEQRLDGIERLMQLPQPPQLVLLDDVYQHRALRPTVSLLLTEYADLFSEDYILPFGNLREFRAGRRRADIIIVTKCPPELTPADQSAVRNRLRLRQGQQLFFSTIDYGAPLPLGVDPQQPAPPPSLDNVLLVTGIAHPAPLVAHLQRQGHVEHLRFADHHDFNEADLRRLRNAFERLAATNKIILTTEKDAQRLLRHAASPHLQGVPLYYIPIKVRLLDGDLKAAISALMQQRLRQ